MLQVFPEEGNMGRVLPNYLSQWTTEKVKGEGVQVLPKSQVHGAAMEDDKVVLTLNDGQKASLLFFNVEGCYINNNFKTRLKLITLLSLLVSMPIRIWLLFPVWRLIPLLEDIESMPNSRLVPMFGW